jgi:hypothetical protein
VRVGDSDEFISLGVLRLSLARLINIDALTRGSLISDIFDYRLRRA